MHIAQSARILWLITQYRLFAFIVLCWNCWSIPYKTLIAIKMLKIGLCDSGLYLGFDNFYCAYIHRLKPDWASLWNSLLITIAIPSKNIICWNCKPFLSSTPTLTTFHTSTVCIHTLCMRGCLKPSFILSNKHTKIRLLRRPKIGNIPNTVFQRKFWQNGW